MTNIRSKIVANTKTEQNAGGLLTRDKYEYIRCLEFEHRELENLFRLDAAFWQENLNKANTQASMLQERMQDLLRGFQDQIKVLVLSDQSN